MKKLICMIVLACAVSFTANAQDLKSILQGLAGAVVGDTATPAASLIGTWDYVGPECQFKGDNLLVNAGGEVAAAKVEEQMKKVMDKLNINTIQFIFNQDGTCSYTMKKKTVNGTYTFNEQDKTVVIKVGKKGLTVTAHVVTLGTNMSFVFNADKLMSALKTITGAASKVNSTASTINSIANNFNGMMLGFELKKQ